MIRALGAAAIALLAAGAPAQAEMRELNPVPCAARADVEQILRDAGESRVAISLSGEILVEVWANEETGTGSITGTTAEGWMCLVLSLTNWTRLDEPPPPEGRGG